MLAQTPLTPFSGCQKLFLISHMRGRTSLLSHILGSHPDIAGYYEQHIAHRKPLSGLRLRASLLEEGLVSPGTRYLFDKVLHSHLDPHPDARGVRVVLLRRPDATLKSIIGMGQARNSKWQDEQEAVSYYCRRLQEILQLTQRSRQPAALVKSEAIVAESDAVLQGMTGFLELKVPLSASYESFEKTGKAVSGDPSEGIRAGTILTQARRHDVQLTPALLSQAQDRYGQVLDGLAKAGCIPIP